MCGEHHVIGHILVHYWGENLQGNWWSSGPAFSTESPVFPCLILPCLWQSTNFAGEIHIIQDHPIKNTIFPYFFPGIPRCFMVFSPFFPGKPSPEPSHFPVPRGTQPYGPRRSCSAAWSSRALPRPSARSWRNCCCEATNAGYPGDPGIYWLSIMYSNRWCNHNNNP